MLKSRKKWSSQVIKPTVFIASILAAWLSGYHNKVQRSTPPAEKKGKGAAIEPALGSRLLRQLTTVPRSQKKKFNDL